jgi:CheY-like chemotaxis protein
MNVLIVGDKAAQLAQLARELRALGIRPIAAPSGREGLRRAVNSRPDVVMVDMILEDLDGFEVCRRLRSDPVAADLPIVMITALDDSVHRRRGYRVGADAYLVRPYTPEQLRGGLDAALRWREELRHARVSHEVRLELDSETRYLLELNDFLDALCARTPLDHEQGMHLRQAFLEIGQNAIEWGHADRREQPVEVRFRAYDDRVELEVADKGPGFDTRHLPHAATPEDPLAHLEVRRRMGLRDGGFGLLIARGLVDELRLDDRGKHVTLVKKFPRARGEAPSGSPRTGAGGPAA